MLNFAIRYTVLTIAALSGLLAALQNKERTRASHRYNKLVMARAKIEVELEAAEAAIDEANEDFDQLEADQDAELQELRNCLR